MSQLVCKCGMDSFRRCEHSNEPSCFIKGRDFLDELRD
jgi:putative ribosome biogenesis GTPase RsgA